MGAGLQFLVPDGENCSAPSRNDTEFQPQCTTFTTPPSAQEIEVLGSLSSRPAWSTGQVLGQSGLHRKKIVSKTSIKEQNYKVSAGKGRLQPSIKMSLKATQH